MDFLADECCDLGLVEELRGSGHNVHYVFESKRGLTDDDVLALAFDQQRILITEDKDFGELVYRLMKPAHGIILIRIDVKNRSIKWPRLKLLLDTYPERCAGRFVVIDENKFRFRPLLNIPTNTSK
jgi:predicted nuclease of predicted toxin-antitoxin system